MRKWAWSFLTAARERQPDRSVETVAVVEAAAGIAEGGVVAWDTGALSRVETPARVAEVPAGRHSCRSLRLGFLFLGKACI